MLFYVMLVRVLLVLRRPRSVMQGEVERGNGGKETKKKTVKILGILKYCHLKMYTHF